MASNAQNAQGTILEISSTAGGAKTITGISATSPMIVTSAGHGLVNGDVVAIAGVVGTGMATYLNGNTYVISDGTATPDTWAEVGEIVSGDGFDGTSAVITKTNLASTAVEKDVGLQDFGSLKLEIQIYDADAGQTAMRAAKTNQTQKNFKVTYPNGETRTFAGFVMSFSEKFGVDSIVTGSTEILIDGVVTYA